MKCGIIGLGDIAQKAYLPVITRMPGLELVLCTRKQETRERIGREYRIANQVADIDALLDTGIEAAFVHTATEAHYPIVRTLLEHGVHVYVDKPLAYTYQECEELVELAEARGKILMVGFNRRFAPMVADMKKIHNRTSVIIQKNRPNHPASVRHVVYDDFVHVLDTVRFLCPGPVKTWSFDGRVEEGNLKHVLAKLSGDGFICVASMGRDFGVNEEIIEVTSPGNKWRIEGLTKTIHNTANQEQVHNFGDWTPVLFRRGFNYILEHFLASVAAGNTPNPSARDSLITHKICEQIVNSLE